MRHQPADKSQINRRPCFLPPTLGTDTSKYHLPKRDRLTCLGLDIRGAGRQANRHAGTARAQATKASVSPRTWSWGRRWRLSGTDYGGDSGPIVYGPVVGQGRVVAPGPRFGGRGWRRLVIAAPLRRRQAGIGV